MEVFTKNLCQVKGGTKLFGGKLVQSSYGESEWAGDVVVPANCVS